MITERSVDLQQAFMSEPLPDGSHEAVHPVEVTDLVSRVDIMGRVRGSRLSCTGALSSNGSSSTIPGGWIFRRSIVSARRPTNSIAPRGWSRCAAEGTAGSDWKATSGIP